MGHEQLRPPRGESKQWGLVAIGSVVCAFCMSWGSGLQKLAPFDVSKIFVVLATAVSVWWLVTLRRNAHPYTTIIRLWVLLVTVHTLLSTAFSSHGNSRWDS